MITCDCKVVTEEIYPGGPEIHVLHPCPEHAEAYAQEHRQLMEDLARLEDEGGLPWQR
jgi:hypothetical protein